MNTLIKVLMLLVATWAGNVWARADVPIVNYDNVAIVTQSGKKLESSQIQQAIGVAGAAHGWTVAANGENKVIATLLVRGKHTAVVDISWKPEAYSIHFKSSINLNYKEKDGVPVIHPFYNKWVATLRDDINRELARQ